MAAGAEVRHHALAKRMQRTGIHDAALTDRINEAWAPEGKSVTRQYITMLRNGQRSRCSTELAQRIADVLGVKASYLFKMPKPVQYKPVSESRKRPAHNGQKDPTR